MKKILNRLLKFKLLQPYNASAPYKKWIRSVEPRHHPSAAAISSVNAWAVQNDLTLSVIVPVYNPNPKFLALCIQSVIGQSFKSWELCIADDASTDQEVNKMLEKFAANDPRIKVVLRSERGHISSASNSAIDLATGRFIALLDHDDQLAEHALHHMAAAIQANPDARFFYSDEDKINESNERRPVHLDGNGWVSGRARRCTGL